MLIAVPGRSDPPQVDTIRLVSRDPLTSQVAEFILDPQARGLSSYTITWYRQQLRHLLRFLDGVGVQTLEDVTPSILRAFLRDFAQTHNPGGTHGPCRATRALFNWFVEEYELPANPISKMAAPRVPRKLLAPVKLDDLRRMPAACPRRTFYGDRDRAIMLFLLDSGCRRGEFLALNVGDVNLSTGPVLVRHGKGGKWRTAFVGQKARRALVRYLRHRRDPNGADPLWANKKGQRLSATALRAIAVRRARDAGVAAPSLQSFRRGFALACLRGGIDLVSLQRLMGHSNLSVLARYLAQTEDDLRRAHEKGGPLHHLL